YGDGLLASLHVSRLSPVKVRHFLAVGTRGSILYNDMDPSERLKVYDRDVDLYTEPAQIYDALSSPRSEAVVSPRLDATEALSNLIEHFAACIEGRATPATGGEQGVRVVRILDAAQASMSRGSARVRV